MTATTRFWRWPTYSRLALENEYQRDFIRSQQAEVEQLRAIAEAAEALIERTVIDPLEIGRREVRLSVLLRAVRG